jgi:hypothetical protein
MTDRELLELAAKTTGACEGVNGYGSPCFFISREEWNPLEDDGDALRLGVKLFLTIGISDGFTDVLSERKGCTEPHSTTNSYAATRRAIVKAAAEIGKDMK